MERLDAIEGPYLKKTPPAFDIGDTVDVHVKVTEGEKERVQIFTGIVIKRKGRGVRETFTVRRLVQGEGVERIFPLHAPTLAALQVRKKGKIRRAKLYYLRERVGKATKLKEKIWDRSAEAEGAAPGAEPVAASAPTPAPAPAPTPAS